MAKPVLEVYGQVVRELELPGLFVTETLYGRNLRLPFHSHAHGYLSIVLQGAYREVLNRRTDECPRGVMIWHPPDEIHANEFDSIETRCLNILPRSSPGLDLNDRVYSKSGVVFLLAAKFYRELCAPDEFSPLILDGLTLELLGETLRTGGAPPFAPPWLKRVESMIRDSFDQSLSLSRMAREAGVHPVHLTRVFRRFHRCTPGEYLRRVRMQSASTALSTTRISIAEIAQQCGFSDQSSFSKTFRKATGFPPARFRREFGVR